jgi:hypothetical protein
MVAAYLAYPQFLPFSKLRSLADRESWWPGGPRRAQSVARWAWILVRALEPDMGMAGMADDRCWPNIYQQHPTT